MDQERRRRVFQPRNDSQYDGMGRVGVLIISAIFIGVIVVMLVGRAIDHGHGFWVGY